MLPSRIVKVFCLFLLVTLYSRVFGKRWSVQTVAGDGSTVSVEDGITATSSSLFGPVGIWKDSLGLVYVADSGHHRIRIIDSMNIIATVAGTGALSFNGDDIMATSASLSRPWHAIGDIHGNIYISDTSHHRIRTLHTDGTINTLVGNGTCGFSMGTNGSSSMVCHPHGLFHDCASPTSCTSLYFADTDNCLVRKVDLISHQVTIIAGKRPMFCQKSQSGTPSIASPISYPYSIWVSGAADVYIAGGAFNSIDVVSASNGNIYSIPAKNNGSCSTQDLHCISISSLWGQAVAAGKGSSILLYTSDFGNNTIGSVELSSTTVSLVVGNSSSVYAGDYYPATSTGVNTPLFVYSDSLGNVYYSDSGNNRVIKLYSTGNKSTHGINH